MNLAADSCTIQVSAALNFADNEDYYNNIYNHLWHTLIPQNY